MGQIRVRILHLKQFHLTENENSHKAAARGVLVKLATLCVAGLDFGPFIQPGISAAPSGDQIEASTSM